MLGLLAIHYLSRFLNSSVDYLKYETLSIAWKKLTVLILTKQVIPFVIIFYLPELSKLPERIKESAFYREFLHEGGESVRWAGIGTYRQRSMKVFKIPLTKENLPNGYFTDEIYLGRSLLIDDPDTKIIAVDDDAHMLTIGIQGSGKSTTAIYPNLAFYAGDAIVIDPKGEHAKTTMARRQGKLESGYNFPSGSKCYMLDPFGLNEALGASSYYNPLSEIDMADQSQGQKIIKAIVDGCVEMQEGDGKHFSETSQNILAGVIAHVVSTFPEDKRTLPVVWNTLNGIAENSKIANFQNFEKLKTDLTINPAFGGLAQEAGRIFKEMGPNESGSMVTTIARSINWISDPKMREHLSKSDFSFKNVGIGENIQTIYLVIPLGKISSQKRWMRTITSVSIAAMRDRPVKPKIPTLYVLDEFPQMGNLEIIMSGFATLRSEKIKLWPFVQNLAQLKANFGDNWSTFIANSNTQIFGVGMGDTETAEWLSKSLGEGKDENGNKAPLLSPAEVMNTLGKNDPRQVILPCSGVKKVDNLPMRLERLTYKPTLPNFQYLKSKGHFSDWTNQGDSLSKIMHVMNVARKEFFS
jgi:type IV secretion system protein VirD4